MEPKKAVYLTPTPWAFQQHKQKPKFVGGEREREKGTMLKNLSSSFVGIYRSPYCVFTKASSSRPFICIFNKQPRAQDCRVTSSIIILLTFNKFKLLLGLGLLSNSLFLTLYYFQNYLGYLDQIDFFKNRN
jgi:hypothetical protein